MGNLIGETSGLVTHCQELLNLFLNFLVDLIFIASLYALHRWSNRMVAGITETRKIKKETKNDKSRTKTANTTRAA